jgi:outer membrane receptor protein involved in Fe transport
MKKLFPLYGLLLLFDFGYAQSVSGKVQDEQGNNLPFVNVLLLNSSDSSLIKGAATNDAGYYSIDNLHSGKYLLAASMVGYKMTYTAPLDINAAQDIKAPELVLMTDVTQLNEVSVTATRPFIEQAIDRTIINVANSIISGGSTALEVLEKSPGVSVDRQNDGIALRGKDGVMIMLDGKQTYLAMADVVALLRSMPSENIDKIELITNPSAKFDAAGNSGIINIVLKKNNNYGTNGSLSLAIGHGRFDRERASFQINNRSKKINFFSSLSASRGGNYWDFDLYRKQDNGEGGFNYVDQDSFITFRNTGLNGKAGVDYSIGKKTTIGMVYTFFLNNSDEESPAYTTMSHEESGEPYLEIITEKTLSNSTSNQIGNVNFQHDFGGKGGTWSADFDIGRYRRDYSNQLITTTLISEDPVDGLTGLFTVMPSSIDIVTFKTDYSRPLIQGWKIDLGLKTSSVSSDNDMKLSSGPVDDMQLDPELSNHFVYEEKVFAVYTSVVGKLSDKTEIQAGLRMEHTNSVGESLSLNQKVDRSYVNFFPTAYISRNFSAKQNLTFSYSYRIDRPNYQNLNPARSYLDPYAFQRGNPYLKPQYTHSIELKHGFDGKIFISVGANYVTDYVFHLIQPVGTQTSERTPDNIGESQAYNINISFPVNFSKSWSFQGNMMGIYSRLEYVYLGEPLSVEQVNGRFNGTNSFILGKGWTGELTGWLNTPATNTIFVSPWLGALDAGLQKSFKSKLKIKISLSDIFKTNRWVGNGKTTGYEQNARLSFDTRVLMFNLTYPFGNQQMKGVRQRKTASEDEVQRTN